MSQKTKAATFLFTSKGRGAAQSYMKNLVMRLLSYFTYRSV